MFVTKCNLQGEFSNRLVEWIFIIKSEDIYAGTGLSKDDINQGNDI